MRLVSSESVASVLLSLPQAKFWVNENFAPTKWTPTGFDCHALPMAKRAKGNQSRKAAPPVTRRKFPPIPLMAWFKRVGVKQREVADAIGADASTLSLVGSGAREYMRHHLEDVAAFLTERAGYTITPSMLLHPPAEPSLAAIISTMNTRKQRWAARMLNAALQEEGEE